MANYDFNCGKCHNIFEVSIPMSEYSAEYVKTLRCPYCGSALISREYTPVSIKKITADVSDKTRKNLNKIVKHKNRTSSSEYAL